MGQPITWQNVTSPDFSSTQSAIRNAADLMNNGFAAARGVTNDIQAAHTADEARQKADVERIITGQLMAAKTPDEIAAIQAASVGDGIAGVTRPDLISPEFQKQMDGRRDILQNRADLEVSRARATEDRTFLGKERTEQGKTWEQAGLDRTRKADIQKATDYLGPALAGASRKAVYNLPGALKDYQGAVAEAQKQGIPMPQEAIAAGQAELERLFHPIDPNAAAAGKERRDLLKFSLDTDAAMAQIAKMNGNPEKITPFFDDLHPTVQRMLAEKMVSSGRDPEFINKYLSPNPSYGGLPQGVALTGPDGGFDVRALDKRLEATATKLTGDLTDPMRVVIGAQGKEMLTVDQAADELVARLNSNIKDGDKHWDASEVRSAVKLVQEEAAKRNPPVQLNGAEAAGLVSLYTGEDRFFTVSNFAKGADLLETDVLAQATKMDAARTGASKYLEDKDNYERDKQWSLGYRELEKARKSASRAVELGRKDAAPELARLDVIMRKAVEQRTPRERKTPDPTARELGGMSVSPPVAPSQMDKEDFAQQVMQLELDPARPLPTGITVPQARQALMWAQDTLTNSNSSDQDKKKAVDMLTKLGLVEGS